uniref:Uncharacterized protein n=1 Tax=Heterorhabditis bacteriophora TaxID=37862 RepID=A0A1I7X7P6_HETBA
MGAMQQRANRKRLIGRKEWTAPERTHGQNGECGLRGGYADNERKAMNHEGLSE